MARQLNEVLGSYTPETLFADGRHEPDVFSIWLKAGQGVLKRGSLIAMSSAGADGILMGSDAAPIAQELTLTSKVGTVTKAGLDVSTLAVYDAEGGTLAALTTDYTVTYESDTLTVTATDSGALASAQSCYIVCKIAADNVTPPNCVLMRDVDTGTEDGEHVPGAAWRSGHFAGNYLVCADGYEITDADKEHLRTLGIFLSNAGEAMV